VYNCIQSSLVGAPPGEETDLSLRPAEPKRLGFVLSVEASIVALFSMNRVPQGAPEATDFLPTFGGFPETKRDEEIARLARNSVRTAMQTTGARVDQSMETE